MSTARCVDTIPLYKKTETVNPKILPRECGSAGTPAVTLKTVISRHNDVLLVEFRGEIVGTGEDVSGLALSTTGDTAAADELPNENRFTDNRRSKGALEVVRCRGRI